MKRLSAASSNSRTAVRLLRRETHDRCRRSHVRLTCGQDLSALEIRGVPVPLNTPLLEGPHRWTRDVSPVRHATKYLGHPGKRENSLKVGNPNSLQASTSQRFAKRSHIRASQLGPRTGKDETHQMRAERNWEDANISKTSVSQARSGGHTLHIPMENSQGVSQLYATSYNHQ